MYIPEVKVSHPPLYLLISADVPFRYLLITNPIQILPQQQGIQQQQKHQHQQGNRKPIAIGRDSDREGRYSDREGRYSDKKGRYSDSEGRYSDMEGWRQGGTF
jgi:hypothetical protein